MVGETVPLLMLIGAALMLLSLIGTFITLLVLRRRKKKLTAALQAEYGDCGGSQRR